MRGIGELVALVAGFVCVAGFAHAQTSEVFVRDGQYIQLEVWRSDLIHFEYGQGSAEPRIWHTPSILPERRDPSVSYTKGTGPGGEDFVETSDLKIVIPLKGLCLIIQEKKYHNRVLGQFCSQTKYKIGRDLTIEGSLMTHAYGLGQQLDNPDEDRSLGDDWVGRRRESPSPFGNFMKSFIGGAVGDTQVPILYALGAGKLGYGLYLDAIEKLTWDFRSRPWEASTGRDTIRGFLISGADLPAWRRGYVELTGKPLVPPRKMFGLWVSEYGFDNWSELDSKKASLQQQGFPLDGFVLDLQWFGGVRSQDDTPMGGLKWDRRNFPDPEKKLADLRDKENLGLILIEESYVGRARQEHQDLAAKGFLARDCETCGPSYIESNPWWGKGGMIDWSHPDVGLYWHKWKRKPLVDSGVMGHWTDLGEPEMFQPYSWYYGFADRGLHGHASVHNYFSFFWHQGIFQSYEKYHQERRPFVMSRSAAAGSQRFGVAMWSGDIGSNMKSLAAHLRSQMHMSLSGFDYYGADIGGFHRGGLDGSINDLYTQWFANASLLDVPVRPHVENLCNCKETAPDRVGHLQSNRENIILRYRLAPYYYSLAHEAYLTGAPMFPPLLYYFQDDPLTRSLAHQKMIGPWLMTGIVAAYGQSSRQIYLPAGTWFDFHSGNEYVSAGDWIQSESLWKNGRFRLPLMVREGAIIPMALANTTHLSGTSGLAKEIRVFPSLKPSWFDLIEDDGVSMAYREGVFKRTRISQKPTGAGWDILVAPAEGDYPGALQEREWSFRVHVGFKPVKAVKWQGLDLSRLRLKQKMRVGTWKQEGNEVIVFAGKVSEEEYKHLRIDLQ
ncbi:MAG: DUF5110 domain-containing protein [Bdellovibrionaceae bacterium]|nr:DUF5110 domain-containing protein [Bdellovibrionales bacterium]MCB9083473.1 DUF5110 domain-containing protein [Pseudobdellovibrionaceae bacterium]